MKKCPYCAEEIQDEAIICRFCKMDLKAGNLVSVPQSERVEVKARSGVMDGVKIGCGIFIVLPLLILAGLIILVSMGAITQQSNVFLVLIVISVVAFIAFKEMKNDGQNNSKKAQMPATVSNGYWICPSCEEKNPEANGACRMCYQKVSKT